jgi:cytochrome P450
MSQPPQVDLFDPVFKADPYPTYARLRSSAPVHRATMPDGRGVWLITRYEDVLAVLKDERFVKDWRSALAPEQLAEIPPIPEVMKPLSRNMLDTDPPDPRSGIRKVCIVDLTSETIERHADPSGDGYRRIERARRGETIESVALPELTLSVDTVLGSSPQ